MSGRPIARVALIAVFLLVLAWPVWSLTRQQSAPPPVVAPPLPGKTVEADLAVTSSVPATVEIYLANTCIGTSSMVQSATHRIRLPAGEKINLLVRGRWADSSTPQALRVVVSWDGENLADQTFWGNRDVEDVLTFATSQP